MGDVQLLVNGNKHGGWKTVMVTRTIDSVAGGYEESTRLNWRVI